MDRFGHDAEQLEEVLDDIEQVNRWLGGLRTLQTAMQPILAAANGHRPLRILDVGTGSGDLPRAIVRWARECRTTVDIVAVDRDPTTATIAAKRSIDHSTIRVVCADANRLPFSAGSFDVVTASMFLHHFRHEQVVALLREFRRLASTAVIVNDLRRDRVAWGFIWLVAHLTGRGAMFRHDAPLSVLRGFTPAELEAAAIDADCASPELRRRWPYRLLLTCAGDA
ncbi:MAG: methyltransferase domain-containing protein [Acidobacteriota bacterium]|nr:methyltransferase domain-containing protein [Acidobacteriota bacterium]